jgi:4-carboxymuconolactone decarboxylase
MQRIPFPDQSQLPVSMQKTLQQVPLNVVRMCAHASQLLFEAQGQLGRAIASPDVLEPKLRETVILRVAYLCGSHYELHHHIPLGRSVGLTEAELTAIGDRDYNKLPPLLGAAARFTDEVVRQMSPADETLDALRTLSSDQVLVNIVLTIGCYMSIARLAAVTGIDPDKQVLNYLPTKLEDGAA